MNSLIPELGALAGQNHFLAYFIIYFATIFLGNISAFASFWIVTHGHLGTWGVPILVLVIFLSNLTGDLLWYSLGHTTRGTRFGNWIRRRLPSWHDRMEEALHKNAHKWMLLSKFIYAATFPVVFSAGWTKMSFKRFFKYSVLSALLWLPVLTGLAYGLISGLSPLSAISSLRNFEILFFIGLVVFLLADYFLAKAMGKFFRFFEEDVTSSGAEDD